MFRRFTRPIIFSGRITAHGIYRGARKQRYCQNSRYDYNLGNVWLGTPCILGKEGIYGKLRLKLTDEETEKLKFSANVVAKNYDDALSSIII